MAIGEHQMAIQPGARLQWQGRAVELPGRDQHLLAEGAGAGAGL